MAKSIVAGVVGIFFVAALSLGEAPAEKGQPEAASVFIPPWEGVFRVDQKDLIRLKSSALDWQQIEIHVEGPAVVQRTIEIVPDKEHSRFAVAKAHAAGLPGLVEGANREFEIRPTGPGRVAVKIERSTKQEWNGRQAPVVHREVKEYGFIVE